MERPSFDAEVNVVGTVNVLEAARAAGAQVVFASTGGAIYGDVDGARRARTRRSCPSPRTASRSSPPRLYLDGWNRIHGSAHVVLRFANVYGPRQSAALEGGVIAIFLERLAAGEPTTIFGDGTNTRDFVHVDDVVRALLLAGGRRGGVFNVGTGIETSVSELHELCEQAVGVDAPAVHGPPRAGDAHRSVLDTSRAAAELGFTAEVALGPGIADDARRHREGVAGRRANPSPVDHPLRLERVEVAVRPWRTATLVVAAVAAVELVLLVVIGGALLARRSPPHPPRRRGRRRRSPPRRLRRRPPRAATRAAQADLPRRKVKVVVLNGNGRTGAAAAAASRVSHRGYRLGVVGNAPSHDYPRSIVMYRTGFAAEGRRLARDLGVRIVSPLDGIRPRQLSGAHAVLILGA